jgi:hypothetical protein
MKPELKFVVEKLETRLEMQVLAAPISTNACASACAVASPDVISSCALQPLFR